MKTLNIAVLTSLLSVTSLLATPIGAEYSDGTTSGDPITVTDATTGNILPSATADNSGGAEAATAGLPAVGEVVHYWAKFITASPAVAVLTVAGDFVATWSNDASFTTSFSDTITTTASADGTEGNTTFYTYLGSQTVDFVNSYLVANLAAPDAMGPVQDEFGQTINVTGASIIAGVGSDFEPTAVPEPSSTALIGLGGLVLMLRRRRQ